MGRNWRDDLFVPKQLGWGCCLGLVCLLPALTVRRRSRSSVGVVTQIDTHGCCAACCAAVFRA